MRIAFLPLLALLLSACGSRSSLGMLDGAPGVSTGTGAAAGSGAMGGGGAGGSGGGGSGGATTSSTSSSGGGTVCHAIELLQPVIVAPLPAPARSPEIGFATSDSDFFLSFIQAPKGEPGTLQVSYADPLSAWPPELSVAAELQTDVVDFVTGSGPNGPVGLLEKTGEMFLATTFVTQIEGIALLPDNDRPLFVQGIEKRYLTAREAESPGFDTLHVLSYQPGAVPHSEDPLVCIKRSLGAAVPAGTGFLAAFNEPGDGLPTCDAMSKPDGTSIALMRYESPPVPGSSLERTDGDRLSLGEPLVHVALAPASFGGWLVFQTDGSTARFPPPVLAVAVDSSGKLLPPNGPFIAVTPGGQISAAVAVASLGDTLAVATVDAIDPSAPTIVVQLVQPDGSLGPATSIPTNAAWLSGRIRMAASLDRQHLLVAWEGKSDSPGIGLARIDCLNAL